MAATAPWPGSVTPHGQADRTWETLTVSFPTPSFAGTVVPLGGSRATYPAPISQGLTLRYSTGLVTLNLSIVVMMIAGVVRKKRRMKRTTLITRQRIHQMKPRIERCSLGKGKAGIRRAVWGRRAGPGSHIHTMAQPAQTALGVPAQGSAPPSQIRPLAQPGWASAEATQLPEEQMGRKTGRVHPCPISRAC